MQCTVRRRRGLAAAHHQALEEAGDKASEEEKEAINKAIGELEEALKGSDKDDIDAKTKALTEASGNLAQKMYAEAQQAEGGEAGAGEQQKSGDDVVDAEFEEVDDDKKK